MLLTGDEVIYPNGCHIKSSQIKMEKSRQEEMFLAINCPCIRHLKNENFMVFLCWGGD
jgi:hypothetical protein